MIDNYLRFSYTNYIGGGYMFSEIVILCNNIFSQMFTDFNSIDIQCRINNVSIFC